MNICIIGMGVLGITYCSILSDSEVNVIGVDTDEETINMLVDGEMPVYEPGLKALVTTSIGSGHLRFSSNIQRAIQKSDLIFITCEVPTGEDGLPDLRFMKPIAQSIGNHMDHGVTVIIKSTIPPGSTKIIKNTIQTVLDERGVDLKFEVVSNPDFGRKGSMIKDCLVPEIVVIGADSQESVHILKELYKDLHIPEENYVVTDPQSAEMIKYGLNAFLAIKLSYVNELALLCENANANISDVVKGISHDRRVGLGYMNPGPGYGGSDLPKDSKAFVEIAKVYGEEFKVLEGAVAANEKQKQKMVKKIKRTLGDLSGKTICFLGLSYKPGTADMREAPSIEIIKGIVNEGGFLKIYCPEGIPEGKWRLHKEKENITYCKDIYEAAKDADALVIMTEWHEFREMDLEKIKGLMNGRQFIDYRNIFEKNPPKGFIYSGLGMPLVEEKEVKR
ncbi:MAG: UDP-glucose dehydrogenase family protein [Eubacteriaceae bacterium]